MTEFDLLQSPLAGVNLIEASAGSGKTYTISRIFLRLLMERHFTVERILVVTFTEAATKELRGRIRAMLAAARQALSGVEPEDPILGKLAARYSRSDSMKRWLESALRGFDEAAIYTIHGFCRRVLHENAFESAALFETELITEQEAIFQEVVDDFWRRTVDSESLLFCSFLRRELPLESLAALLRSHVSKPFLRIIPEEDGKLGAGGTVAAAEADYLESQRRLLAEWASHGGEILELMRRTRGLDRRRYSERTLEKIAAVMDGLSADVLTEAQELAKLRLLAPGSLANGTRKDGEPPRHPFFALCGSFCDAAARLEERFAARRRAMVGEAFRFTRRELAARKEKLGVQFFDDLLTKLYEALRRPEGGRLAESIRLRYGAALIDEFQDTDPLQYEIFHRIYANGTLFMIGDPKQSIYSFRGADVFAYLRASREAEERYSLSRNWRSDGGLIRAVNALFGGRPDPFLLPEIRFEPSEPAEAASRVPLLQDGKPMAPMAVYFLPRRAANAGQISKEDARRTALSAAVSEIARLLGLHGSAAAVLGDRPLAPRDVAVLVRKNLQAREVQRALRLAGIPSVLYSTESLFASREARDMWTLLDAVADPADDSRLKAALATDYFPHTLEEIERAAADQARWEHWCERFNRYHELWRRTGFMAMIRELGRDQAVGELLLGLSEGERRITNFQHLVEVLHEKAVSDRLGMEGLIKWFRRAMGSPAQEEHQIRLETDEEAVWIVTVHRSKGLEFPVVFCPFLWDTSRDRGDPPVFHEPDDPEGRLIMDLGSKEIDAHRDLADRERLAEDLRLLYVAVSRAKNHCSFTWGNVHLAEAGAPAYLLHPAAGGGAAVSALQALRDEEILSALYGLEERSEGSVEIRRLPEEAPPRAGALGIGLRSYRAEETELRATARSAARPWRLASYSALTAGREVRFGEGSDHDEWAEAARAGEEEPAGIFAFPRGARAGSFFHALFEELDFPSCREADVEELAASRLERSGFDPEWAPVVGETVARVLALPMDGKDLRLSEIPRSRTLREMEFTFPVRELGPEDLGRVFREELQGEPAWAAQSGAAAYAERLAELPFRPHRGFMRGFVDLVFLYGGRWYVLDWKSSFLGGRIEDYGPEQLRTVMLEEHYVLQYSLYTVALQRYLRRRLPDYDYARSFGGVFYLFLRGVDPARGPDFGVFYDLPPRRLIDGLDQLLAGRGKP